MKRYIKSVIDSEVQDIIDDMLIIEYYYKNSKSKRAKEAYYKLWYALLVMRHQHGFGINR